MSVKGILLGLYSLIPSKQKLKDPVVSGATANVGILYV